MGYGLHYLNSISPRKVNNNGNIFCSSWSNNHSRFCNTSSIVDHPSALVILATIRQDLSQHQLIQLGNWSIMLQVDTILISSRSVSPVQFTSWGFSPRHISIYKDYALQNNNKMDISLSGLTHILWGRNLILYNVWTVKGLQQSTVFIQIICVWTCTAVLPCKHCRMSGNE